MKSLLLAALCLGWCMPGTAAFVEDFAGPDSVDAWQPMAGDGQAQVTLTHVDDFARIDVDARQDRRGIWWALIKRPVQDELDLQRLAMTDAELRIQARVRVSHSPRRVNLHLNTQRTTDFHSHLLEFDIDRANEWREISMTTKGFDARPGDTVNAQLALMDWGQEQYQVEIDHFSVEVVDPSLAPADVGGGVPYHPQTPPPESFINTLVASEDTTVDARYPDINFNGWGQPDTPLLSINGDQMALLRFDFSGIDPDEITGGGMLSLSAHSVAVLPDGGEDFGQIRVVEVLAGPHRWEDGWLAYARLLDNQPLSRILNGQMIIDGPLASEPGEQAYFSINQAVLKRLASGRTKGIALLPLGAISAHLHAAEAGERRAPKLYFNTRED